MGNKKQAEKSPVVREWCPTCTDWTTQVEVPPTWSSDPTYYRCMLCLGLNGKDRLPRPISAKERQDFIKRRTEL
jgi:hypothetical protein